MEIVKVVFWNGVEDSGSRFGNYGGWFSDECIWWYFEVYGQVIRVEWSMLVCSGGVMVVIGGFDEEAIDKAVVCVIVSTLSRKCCGSWYIG